MSNCEEFQKELHGEKKTRQLIVTPTNRPETSETTSDWRNQRKLEPCQSLLEDSRSLQSGMSLEGEATSVCSQEHAAKDTIVTISSPPSYQWAVRVSTGQTPVSVLSDRKTARQSSFPLNHRIRDSTLKQCFLFFVLLLLFGLPSAMIAIGACTVAENCTGEVPRWLIAFGAVQFASTILTAIHHLRKRNANYTMGEHELPDLDSIFNRICLLMCYASFIFFLVFTWIIFSEWQGTQHSSGFQGYCSNVLLVFGIVAIIIDIMLVLLLLWLYRKPVMYAAKNPQIFILYILFLTLLLITFPFGSVFLVNLDKMCNPPED